MTGPERPETKDLLYKGMTLTLIMILDQSDGIMLTQG